MAYKLYYMHMKFLFTFVFLLSALFVPMEVVTAQAGGFVPCSGTDCGSCNVVQLINNVIVWLLGIVFVIFAVMMTVAGFGLVTSGGNQAALDAAKSKFQNGLIGIIIILAGYIIVDTLMRGIVGGGSTGAAMGELRGWGPWSSVQCTTQTTSQPWAGDPATPPAPGQPAPAPLPGPAPTGCSGGTCVPLGIPCSNANSCSISPDLAARFQAFHAAAGVSGARVTEAMPPTRTHRSACHNNGTCLDYSRAGGMTADEVVRVINAANANGLRPVYEVHTTAQRDALVAAGAPAANIAVLGNWISAPHFSIYGY